MDAEKMVSEIPSGIFREQFISRIGKDKVFSKLRCCGGDELDLAEWCKIKQMFSLLGLPRELTMSEMEAVAFALTRRAVLKKK